MLPRCRGSIRKRTHELPKFRSKENTSGVYILHFDNPPSIFKIHFSPAHLDAAGGEKTEGKFVEFLPQKVAFLRHFNQFLTQFSPLILFLPLNLHLEFFPQ